MTAVLRPVWRRRQAGLTRWCSSFVPDVLLESNSHVPDYWISELKRVNRASAVALLRKLVPSNSLGFSGAVDEGFVSKRPKDASKLRVVDLATSWKRQQPELVLLVRVGDFYETWGTDAVMLVQHAGLNPMGDQCRAGCPKANIQQTLTALTDAGLSVGVYEEANIVGSRSKKIRKERYLSQVVTPGRPIYLHDTSLKAGELPYRASKPYAAIRCTEDGCSVGLFWVDSKEVRVTESVTEEAVGSVIESVGGVAEPVWLSLSGITGSRFLSAIPNRTRRFPISLSSDAFLTAAANDISRILALEHSATTTKSIGGFRLVTSPLSDGMNPAHATAASFLGLSPSPGTPDLVKNIVPITAPFFTVNFFRNWLLCPPPRAVCDAMRRTVELVSSLSAPIPHYRVVPVDKLVRLLESKNGNHHFFLDLWHACEAFITTPETLLNSRDLLHVVSHSAGVSNKRIEDILTSAASIKQRIDKTIHLSVLSVDPLSIEALDRFVGSKENDFVTIVKCDFASLNLARSRLVQAVERSLVAPSKSLKYDQISDVLYVKDVDVALRPEARKKLVAEDGARKRASADLIVKAESDYRESVEMARALAKQQLTLLASDLCRFKEELIFLSHWAVVVTSVALHAEHGIRKGWCLPSVSEGGHKLDSAWPFWLDFQRPAVPNSCQLNAGTAQVLTAPNMSGKSTLIRSIGAIVLLGNTGLMAPAMRAEIQPISDLLVVSPHGDRPSENLSAFAAEADAMSCALRHCDSPKPVLVLIDEFGRGTSAKDAAALSVAVIQWLANRPNVACIWATHLHDLFTAGLNVEWIQMDGFKLMPGQCVDSRGIEIAHERGFPNHIIAHARQYSGGRSATEAEPESENKLGLPVTMPHGDLIQVQPGRRLPPKLQAGPLVYILKFHGDRYYIGETENFGERVKAHRKRFADDPVKIWVAQQPDRSQARATETALIQAFMKEGVSLLSTVDGFHRSSSSAAGSAGVSL